MFSILSIIIQFLVLTNKSTQLLYMIHNTILIFKILKAYNTVNHISICVHLLVKI